MRDTLAVRTFKLAVYPRGQQPQTRPLYKARGQGKGLLKHLEIRIEGFNGSAHVNLVDCWQKALKKQLPRYTGKAMAYETVIKFGDTLQLKTRLDVVIDLTFEDAH